MSLTPNLVEPRGFEPRSNPCHGFILPLKYGPRLKLVIFRSDTTHFLVVLRWRDTEINCLLASPQLRWKLINLPCHRRVRDDQIHFMLRINSTLLTPAIR